MRGARASLREVEEGEDARRGGKREWLDIIRFALGIGYDASANMVRSVGQLVDVSGSGLGASGVRALSTEGRTRHHRAGLDYRGCRSI